MLIFKDELQLDRDFPFTINRYTLNQTDNNEDTFHYHDFCEITCIESGSGRYHVGGKEFDVKAGDLIIFNNVEPHGWTVYEDMKVLVMVFAVELVTDPTTIFKGNYMKPFIERGSNFRNCIEADDDKSNDIRNLMNEIFLEYEEKDDGYKNVIRADIMKILTYLLRHYQREDEIQKDGIGEKKQAMNRLAVAFAYIEGHYTEAITLDEVASMVYMSPNYFSTYFRRLTGYTFKEYVTITRLKRARSLYMSTDMNASDIAGECGFRNMSNFYRLYKKYLGALPKRGNQE